MIKQLRKRFIRIAMLSVTTVMLILSLIVNIANFISTNSDLNQMLDIICENRGSIPIRKEPDADAPGKPEKPDDNPMLKPNGHKYNFNQETPYSTRFFYLRFDENGKQLQADLGHIAAITDGDINEYISVALEHGIGYGYYSNYKFRVIQQKNQKYTAVFLNCYQEIHAVKTVALYSFLAMVICIIFVYISVVFFSKKAIDPVVRSTKQQKQFITDAGHELKTPITVIATSLKVLEMETGKQKWIDKAMLQTERLKELVNALVTLSRMDEEESPLKLDYFSISDAVKETAESFVDYARSSGHELQIEVSGEIEYYGDEYAIRQLVSILLDNAVKYASAGSSICFSLSRNKKEVVICCANECESLNPGDLEHLFDRFYRADQSRNTQTGGFGIGLSIARSIAEGHKGSILEQCPSNNRIEFVVKLKNEMKQKQHQ